MAKLGTTQKRIQGIKDACITYIRERNYHLTEEEIMDAIKIAIETTFDGVIFNTSDLTVIDVKNMVECNIDVLIGKINKRLLIRKIEEQIDKYEREKIFSLFRPLKGSIITAYGIGETFFLGYSSNKILDIKKRFEGPLFEFGNLYGIYVESGKETINIPPAEWSMWELAKYIYDKTGYVMSINPHRKLLKLKKQPKAVIFNINGCDAIMPPEERIKGEEYEGAEWDVVLYDVNQTAREGFQLYVSRRQIDFLVKYLYLYIPELRSYKVQSVAREPGVMAKVLISNSGSVFRPSKYADELKKVSDMLNGEKIEIINQTPDTEELLRTLLNFDGSIKVDSINKNAVVITDRKGKVIGKGGINVKLTGMLTGYRISVMTTEEYITDSNIFKKAKEV